MANKLDGKTLYNMAFPVVDYAGQVTKGSDTYNEYYSPNNLRRLIIAPDVVMGIYYVKVPNIGYVKTIRIPVAVYNMCSGMSDYVPIVKILAGDRVCSSIEEIVFLTASCDGSCSLQYADYDIDTLISSFKSGSGDKMNTLKRRFVRLRYFTRINMNYNNFAKLQVKASEFVAEKFKDSAEVVKIHDEDDWYKNYGSVTAAKTYPKMDGADGHLTRYFKKYISDCEEQAKAQKVKDFTNKQYGKLTEDMNKAYDDFSGAVKKYNKLRSAFKKYGTSVIYGTGTIEIKPVVLPELYAIDDFAKDYPKLKQIDCDKKEAYNINIKECQRMIVVITKQAAEMYWEAVRGANLDEHVQPFIETHVINPGNGVIPYNIEVSNVGMKKSFINSCYWLCNLFLSRNETPLDLFKKEIWEA